MKTREERQAQRAAMPRTQLSAHHMENARLLADRGELLYRIPNGGIGVEVGVAFGEYTAEILEKNRPSRLFLIDPWGMDRYSSGLHDVQTKFETEIASGQVTLMQGTSLDKLAEFDDGFLDWAYIDTDHSFELTWQELLLCEKKVKRTGRIAGHDFCTGNTVKPIVYGVVEAVTKFCRDYGWQFEFLTVESHAHFSYCLKRL